MRKKPGASAMGGAGNPQAGDGLGTSNSPANANNADKPLSAGVPGLNTPAGRRSARSRHLGRVGAGAHYSLLPCCAVSLDRRPNGRALTPQAPVPPLPDMPKSPTEAGRPVRTTRHSNLRFTVHRSRVNDCVG